jgi:hypothetical protein
MTEGRQPFTAEIKTLAKGPSTYDLLENTIRRFRRHFLLAQHDRGLPRSVHGRQMTDKVGPFERHVEKEPQRGDGGVDRRNADRLPRQMHLKTAKVLARGGVRRTAEEGREDPDVPDVAPSP